MWSVPIVEVVFFRAALHMSHFMLPWRDCPLSTLFAYAGHNPFLIKEVEG